MRVLFTIERPVTTTLRPDVHRRVAHLLHPVDVARERGDDDALVGVGEDLPKRRPHLGLRARDAAALGVGGVRHEQQNTLPAGLGDRAVVGEASVDRRLVELEVAGVQHVADGRADERGDAVGDRVVDGHEVESEDAERDVAACAYLAQLRLLDLVLLELAGDQSEGELRAEDGHRLAEVLEQVRQRTRCGPRARA